MIVSEPKRRSARAGPERWTPRCPPCGGSEGCAAGTASSLDDDRERKCLNKEALGSSPTDMPPGMSFQLPRAPCRSAGTGVNGVGRPVWYPGRAILWSPAYRASHREFPFLHSLGPKSSSGTPSSLWEVALFSCGPDRGLRVPESQRELSQ